MSHYQIDSYFFDINRAVVLVLTRLTGSAAANCIFRYPWLSGEGVLVSNGLRGYHLEKINTGIQSLTLSAGALIKEYRRVL